MHTCPVHVCALSSTLFLPQTMDDFQMLKVLGKGTFGKVSLLCVYCVCVRSGETCSKAYVRGGASGGGLCVGWGGVSGGPVCGGSRGGNGEE